MMHFLLAAAVQAGDVSYEKQIKPIFDKSCVSCHGPDKSKGELRLDTPENILRGSEHGKIFVAGDPAKSKIVELISLPPGHDDIMPSKGDPLTKEQIELIKNWITKGAKFDGATAPVLPKERVLKTVPAAAPAALKAITDAGGMALPLAANTNLLRVSFLGVAAATEDKHVALLKPLAQQVMELDLAGTKVTDAGLAPLADLKNLEVLHLERTGVGDGALAHLKGLIELRYLNLYGTQVGDAGLKSLTGLKNLKNLYLWLAKVTDAGAADLKKALPGVVINRGEELVVIPPKEVAPVATTPPINAKCPLTGNPVNATKTFVYKGQTIGFCCGDCLATFTKDPDKLIAKVAEFKAAAPAGDEGFILTWLLLAPIATAAPVTTDATELAKAQIPGEATIKPKAGEKIGELTWKEAKATDYYLDLRAVVKEQGFENAAGYAVCYVTADKDLADLKLKVGVNDQGKGWLNGAEVFSLDGGRSLTKDEVVVEKQKLNKGVNVLVLKVINAGNNWQACARFTTADDKPVAGLKFSIAPQ